ncbi:MAG TPA: hypothetical protein ENF55_03105 [Thermoprotei archaeon]|nr:hypothetical protein [Thermoprotei archaeon]
MVKRIKIISPSVGEVYVRLLDKNPRTVEAIVKALPIESTAMLWGEEVYFSTPIEIEEENAQEVVEVGDVAYWPPGQSICIFFGCTPISPSESEIRPASPVNVFGRIEGDPKVFKRVREGEKIRVELAD